MKFKKGDYVFYEFNICKIDDFDGDIYSLDAGFGKYDGVHISEIIELNLETTNISIYFSKLKDKIPLDMINYRKISRHLVELWLDFCKNEKSGNCINAKNFMNKILDKYQEIKNTEIDGIKVFE
jgi:hypothetical protein